MIRLHTHLLLMQTLSSRGIATIASRYEQELHALSGSAELNPMVELLTLTKIQADLPLLLTSLNTHKTSKMFKDTHEQLLGLSNQVDERLFSAVKRANDLSRKYSLEKEEVVNTIEETPPPTDQPEDIASLRKRLLQDGTSTSLDNVSTDKMNDYHETFQEDLLSDLGELASALKSSAATLSSKILDDSKLVASTTENMEKNLTLMQTVGTNLNGYLTNKTGGKISLFFLLKTMAFIFVLTFFMIVLIKILPKM